MYMDILTEITRATGLPVEETLKGFRFTLVSGRACHLMRHNGIAEITRENIIFKINKRRLVIRGGELTVKNLTPDDAVVVGKIDKVELE